MSILRQAGNDRGQGGLPLVMREGREQASVLVTGDESLSLRTPCRENRRPTGERGPQKVAFGVGRCRDQNDSRVRERLGPRIEAVVDDHADSLSKRAWDRGSRPPRRFWGSEYGHSTKRRCSFGEYAQRESNAGTVAVSGDDQDVGSSADRGLFANQRGVDTRLDNRVFAWKHLGNRTCRRRREGDPQVDAGEGPFDKWPQERRAVQR
jgi:hypothetical protein